MWFYITLINSLSNSIITIFFSIYFLDRSEFKKNVALNTGLIIQHCVRMLLKVLLIYLQTPHRLCVFLLVIRLLHSTPVSRVLRTDCRHGGGEGGRGRKSYYTCICSQFGQISLGWDVYNCVN